MKIIIKLLDLFFYYLVVPIGYVVIFTIINYRKKVILGNIQRSFPHKTAKEHQAIRAQFQWHFLDLMVEGIIMLYLPKKELLKRFRFKNPEVINTYYDQNRSVLLVGGHYNNWEYLVSSLDLQFKMQGCGVGKPISNKGFGNMMNSRRTRFGMEVWDQYNVRQKMEQYHKEQKPFCCLLLADQSVNKIENAYWMEFLNQRTPCIFGPEYLSKKYELPLVYFHTQKVKRGHYEAELFLVNDAKVTETSYGDMSFKHNKMLEADINKQPAYWLWSHKRWKHGNHEIAPDYADIRK